MRKRTGDILVSMARPEKQTLALSDLRTLRAYTHPLRMRLVHLLRGEGPLTATQAAALLGETSGSTSFHLRQLARYGVVEETGDGKGRQKPWRCVVDVTSFPDESESPGQAALAESLRMARAQRYFNQVLRAIGRAHREPRSWQRASRFEDVRLVVTARELDTITKAVDEVLGPYRERTKDPSRRPRSGRQVTYLNVAFPSDGPSGPGRSDD